MRFLLPILLLAMAGCGTRATTEEEFGTRLVTLPNGRQIRAEVETTSEEMARGMMFRESLAADHGMLFFHVKPDLYRYWMFQCKIPLDIIWMDSERRIVEISANTPPCQKPASECPSYGGTKTSQFVLEMKAGEAARNRLKTGDTLTF